LKSLGSEPAGQESQGKPSFTRGEAAQHAQDKKERKRRLQEDPQRVSKTNSRPQYQKKKNVGSSVMSSSDSVKRSARESLMDEGYEQGFRDAKAEYDERAKEEKEAAASVVDQQKRAAETAALQKCFCRREFPVLPPHPDSSRHFLVAGLKAITSTNSSINTERRLFNIPVGNVDDDDVATVGRRVAWGCGFASALGSVAVALVAGLAAGTALVAAGAACLALHKYSMGWSSWVDPESYERMGLAFKSVYSSTNEIDDLDLRTVYAQAKTLARRGRIHYIEVMYVNALDDPKDAKQLPHPVFVGIEALREGTLHGTAFDEYYHDRDSAWIQERQLPLFVHDELLLELLQKFRNPTESLSDRFKRMEDDVVRMAAPFEISRYERADVLADTLLLAKLVLKYRHCKQLLMSSISRTHFQ